MKLRLLLLCVVSSSFYLPGQGELNSNEDYEEENTNATPNFLTKSAIISVKENETARFPCEVNDLGDYIIIWKKNEKIILFVRNMKLIKDERYTLVKNSFLQLSNVTLSDAGVYTCQITINPPIEIVHKLEVLIQPKVNTLPLSGNVVITQGEEFVVACSALGNPTPTIIWTHKGNVESYERGERISIPSANRSHAGTYKCVASNGVGEPDTGIINVKVLYPPEIKVNSNWIHAGIGVTIDLTCQVFAEPPATIYWVRGDGNSIPANEHFKFKQSGNNHTLQIRNLKEEDMTNYECVVNNSLGTREKTIEVSGYAAPAVIKSKHNGDQPTSYLLLWTVKSHNPIFEFKLQIRTITDNDTSDLTEVTIPNSLTSGMIQSGQYEITGLEPASDYEVIINSRNKYGWNHNNVPFVFSTLGKETILSTEINVLYPVLAADQQSHIYPLENDDSVDSKASTCGYHSFLFTIILASSFLYNKCLSQL